ncbi:hypothetical protein E4H04_08995 [Candidatus Bathyarchaeota archaeon]|nr:MAG: hypothetical protein E4H04_08995 [Candidatus Bathyarchaeota archaeon]
MNNFQKTVYGLIIVLFLSIIIGSTFFLLDYKTVEIKDLELTVDEIQPEYNLGQSIMFNVYLTNNHPYKVQVTLPEYLTHYQVSVNWIKSVAGAIKLIEAGNQTVIIEPYTDQYLATLTYGPQRRTGIFELHIECEELSKILIVNVTDTFPNYIERLDVSLPYNFETVNYTGLPEGEDVRIYPESHIVIDDRFRIVFENNRDEALYWGSYWMAEKYVEDEWVIQNVGWVWTLELRFIDPYSTTVDSERFLFDDGLYRITKRCMLSDNYDRDKKEWIDEFAAIFYLFKIS